MASRPPALQLPAGQLTLDRVRVIGILNTTPDSFYDGGRYTSLKSAVARATQMADEGADVIEVGGEKAGPGEPVSIAEETRRVVPVIAALKRELPLPISVDTFKPEVARAAVEAGADIINSIDGFGNPALRRAAADTGAAIVIMHIQGLPRVANPQPHYDDVVSEVRTFLEERARDCLSAGILGGRIAIDPGPGFGKTTEHDIEVLRHIDRLTALPYPVTLAASRKRFIGDVLGLGPEERLEGSLAVIAWSVLRGVKLVRVHDVKASWRVCRMTEAVLHPESVEEVQA